MSLTVGQKIELNDGRIATIRFVGPTAFQTGEWIGVELDEATGKNDGSVKGQRYFECEQDYGMFLRPAGVRQILEQPTAKPKPARPAGNGVAAAKSRPSSVHASVNGLKKTELAPGRRTSTIGSGSPTPSSRSALSGLRSPTKSPTKQLGSNGISSGSSSRTGTPPATGAASRRPGVAPATRPRPSIGPAATSSSKRASIVPSTSNLASSRSSRSSLAPPATTSRAPTSRTAPTRPTSTRPTPPSRSPNGNHHATHNIDEGDDEDEDGSARPDLLSPRESTTSSALSPSEAESLQGDEDEDTTKLSFAPPPPPPIPPDPAPKPTMSRRTSSPPASLHSQRTVRSTTASNRQIEELEAKVRLLERKRQEDRDIKRNMEQAQQERDKYQSIIEKLQKKYQPQQQEIAELKKALSEAEARFKDVEEMQAEHDSIMESISLDKEMAEETAEAATAELEDLKEKSEEMRLELEILKEENDAYTKEMSPEERNSAGWLQLENENERLRNALLRLRDLTRDREDELKQQLHELDGQVKEFDAVRSQYEENKEKLLTTEATADDLRQQLEAASGADEIIEELTDRNMKMQEKIDELRGTVEDLEDIKELNDELEVNHIEAEKQMQEEIDFKESLLLDRERTARQQQAALDDADYTINRFRELVSQLQSDLQDMQASKSISETEAAELSSKSRAMLDLNMKLQSSAAKTQVKTIDLELRKLEAQEASEHLAIVQLFLPEAFHAERDSVLALLRFKRIGFKASLVQNFVKERVASFSAKRQDEQIFAACDVIDKLTWIAAMAERFVNSICSCTVEEFASYESALYELEPVERALNSYIDVLRRDELKECEMAGELQRSIAVMAHLATLHVKEDLSSHADHILMRTQCLQSQLESTATALGLTRSMIESKLPRSAREDDDGDDDVTDVKHILNRAEALISHTRNAKVMAGKTYRSLADLQARSLTLEQSCTDLFEGAEKVAAEIASYSRHAGDALQTVFGEEGRAEPFTSAEVSSTLSRAATGTFGLSAPEAGPFAALSGRLRDLSDVLTDLASLPTDLDNTVEFERAPAPWVARSTELKQTKTTSIDTEAQLAQALKELHERNDVLEHKDKELDEHVLRIEHLDARLKDANRRSGRISDLERALHEAKDREQRARTDLTQAKKEAERDIERVREEIGRLAEQRRSEGDAIGLDDGAMGAGAKLQAQRQEHQITSLRGAVQYLQDEVHRLRLPAPDSPAALQTSLDWLHEPLLQKPTTDKQRRKDVLRKEGKDALQDLLQLTTKAKMHVDLTKLPENKLAWRPVKESSRWQVEKRKEDWASWKECERRLVKQAKGGNAIASARSDATRKAAMPQKEVNGHVRILEPEADEVA